ncbi:MAG: dihydrodipicolinate synthase family protein [Deltaproteobacteria bacterium]|nr:dihydrodipicolinate synthase family protein [Deltaproteobacteria bacterium]
MFKPEGVYVAMLTPFKQDGRIHEQEMRKMVDFQIQNNVSGLFPVSSVGEYIHMTREEKVALMEMVHDQAKGRVPVTPGVGSSHPEEAIFLAEKAKAIGCDGVVIAPPYFFPLSQNMVEQYFETIIHAVDIPVIIYNIPLFTQPLNYDLVKRLARKPNVVAMKDSSGSMVDFLHFMDKVRLEKGEMNFLTGREETLLPCLMMGGKGCMTATAGILPEVMVEIYQCFLSKEYERARELQFSILQVIRKMFALPFPLGFKIAMEMRGFNMGPPKQPLSDADQSQFNRMSLNIQKALEPIIEQINQS